MQLDVRPSEAHAAAVADNRDLEELRVWSVVRDAHRRGTLGEFSRYRSMTLEQLDAAFGVALGPLAAAPTMARP